MEARQYYGSLPTEDGGMLLHIQLKRDADRRIIGLISGPERGFVEGYVSIALTAVEAANDRNELAKSFPLFDLDQQPTAELLAHLIAISLGAGETIPWPLQVLHVLLPEFSRSARWYLPAFLNAQQVLEQAFQHPFMFSELSSGEILTPTELTEFWSEECFSRELEDENAIFATLESERAVWQHKLVLAVHMFSGYLRSQGILLDALSGLLTGKKLQELEFFQELVNMSTEIEWSEDGVEGGDYDVMDDDMDDDDLDDFDETGILPNKPWPAPARKPVCAYQLKITLEGSKPTIWRRIRVRSDITLVQLHDIIQIIMDWDDAHLYQFRRGKDLFERPAPAYRNPTYGVDDVELRDLLYKPKGKLDYLYDYGDNWEMLIVLEQIAPWHKDSPAAKLLDAYGEAPPEDIGGIPGYLHLQSVLKDPTHPEYEDMRDLIGLEEGEKFDPTKVRQIELQREDLEGWAEMEVFF